MLIRNLTPKVQELKIKMLGGEDRVYDIYLQPHGASTLERATIVLNKEALAGMVSFGDEPIILSRIIEQPPIADPVAPEVDPKPETPEATPEEAPKVSDQFICDECGAEFGSSRGLAAHKSKAHPIEE